MLEDDSTCHRFRIWGTTHMHWDVFSGVYSLAAHSPRATDLGFGGPLTCIGATGLGVRTIHLQPGLLLTFHATESFDVGPRVCATNFKFRGALACNGAYYSLGADSAPPV